MNTLSSRDIYQNFRDLLLYDSISLSKKDFDDFMLYFSKCGILILLTKLKYYSRKSAARLKVLHLLSLNLFLCRVRRAKLLSFDQFRVLQSKIVTESFSINVFAPVCPDYAYTSNGAIHNYTFDSLNDGIGLVARKAISTLNFLYSLLQDSPAVLSRVNSIILLGDFEANEENLSRLNLTEEEFLARVSKSSEKISSETPYNSALFTNLCGGNLAWSQKLEATSVYHSLNDYESLTKELPFIKHDKNLLSRIPLYTKWYGANVDYKSVFLRQVSEYITMGRVISSQNLEFPFILASDHRVMHDYYTAFSDLPILKSKTIDYS